MFLTFKLITCFIDGFTIGMKSQSIAYILMRSACTRTRAHTHTHTYILGFRPWKWRALDMGFVDKQLSRMQGWLFFRSCAGRATISVGFKKISKFYGGLPQPAFALPYKFIGGTLTSTIWKGGDSIFKYLGGEHARFLWWQIPFQNLDHTWVGIVAMANVGKNALHHNFT